MFQGWRNHSVLLLLTALSSIVLAQDVYDTRFENVTWNHTAWQLTTTKLDQGHYQSRMSLANGYIGINVAALGPFFEVDTPVDDDNILGWPLFERRQTFATVGGFWDSQPTTNGTNFPWLSQYGWDSAISGLPHWSGIVLDLGNSTALQANTSSDEIQNFTSTLDMRQGLMNWAYTWSPSGHGSFDISYQMFVHKAEPNQAYVTLNVTAQQDTNVTVVNVLNGDCAVRTVARDSGLEGNFLYSAVSPNGVDNVTAYVYTNMTVASLEIQPAVSTRWNESYVGNNESSIAGAVALSLASGQTTTIFKYVGVASTDGFEEPDTTARSAVESAMTTGYDAALTRHVAEWAWVFPSTSVDDFSFQENGSLPDDPYVVESAILAVVNPFHLLQNTLSENATTAVGNASINDNSITVGGLGSAVYGGQVFWDAEIWMQPGLVATFPFAAQGISNYRISRYAQAQQNVNTSYQSSTNQTEFSTTGAIFPWTSGRFGNCTATGPCWDYEYHLNGDVAQEFMNYWITSGDTEFFQDHLYPIYDSVAITYSELLQPNGSLWSLTNMTDPDEYANHVDNGGFTMPLIADTLLNANAIRRYFNDTPNTTWVTQAENVLIERDEDSGISLEYTDMLGNISVKQADVVLVTFPLSYTGQNHTAEDSLTDLDYYASKQSSDGPGMTYAIFSIVANQVSSSGCSSFTYDQYSSHPYARPPWFQFSEQLVDNFQENGGTHPSFPFLTGHGGSNQVVLFGYLGLRLIPDWVLHIDPSLPPQIPQIRYRTFHWRGWPISAFSNQTHTTLFRDPDLVPASGAVPNTTFTNTPIPVRVGSVYADSPRSYNLSLGETVVIPNRRSPHLNQTAIDNTAQCQPITSPDDFLPGQFPFAAVDGALSTKWQPRYANQTASVTVQVTPGQRVRGFVFYWAQAPPYNYSVAFHNTSDGGSQVTSSSDATTVVQSDDVTISTPYDPETILTVLPVASNTTVYMLDNDSDETLFTVGYATLTIWGSQLYENVTRENMSGEGATVAEWNILVDGGETRGRQRRVGRRKRSEDEVVGEADYYQSLLTRGDSMRRRMPRF